MKYYLVGIKGSGMAALACILKDLGYEVAGVDKKDFLFTQEKLIKKGIVVEDFSNYCFDDADIIVVGNAFLDTIDLYKGKETITYQEMVSIIASKYYSIAVCGTHGKTTTSNMIRHVLSKIDEVGYLIGDGTGKAQKNSKYFVFEACEHRKHFLSYFPDIIVATNIDYDHVDYYQSKKKYKEAFYSFFKHAKDKLIINSNIKYKTKHSSFGYKKGNVYAKNIEFLQIGTKFDLIINDKEYKEVFLPFFGKHMLENVLACIACMDALKININQAIDILKQYENASRRYDSKQINSNVIVDDYGHHPKEIKSTILAIKQQYVDKKIIVIYHPDRPKRITCFHQEFINAFKKVDKVYLLPFINHKKEEENAIISLLDNKKIVRFSDDLFINKYENTVFLFTGSKDMKNIIEKLTLIL